MQRTLLAILIILPAFVGGLDAQVLSEYRTILDVKTNARQYDDSDKVVELKGKFTKQIGQEMFSFRDNTGVIRVEVDDSWRPIIVIGKQVSILITVDDDENLIPEAELEALNYCDDIELSSIAYVRDNAPILDRHERILKIRGKFVKQYNHEHYLFSDGKEEIRVEIESYLTPALNTECTILLSVDFSNENIDVEVRNVLL
ncbi:MAG: NirD/YgiW/YdeI family stress tolerance protein [Bacteroidales bacterium]